MRNRLILLAGMLSFFQLSSAQLFPSDTLRYSRFVSGENRYHDLPLSYVSYLENTGYRDRYGWLSDESLQPEQGTDLILVAMNSNSLPEGEWSKITASGSFMFAAAIPSGTRSFMLDTMRNRLHMVCNYLSRGEYEPLSEASGLLTMTQGPGGSRVLSGTVTIKGEQSDSQQKIVFSKAAIPASSYEGFVRAEKERRNRENERQEAVLSVLEQIAGIEKAFYDSLFNSTLYPGNDMKASLQGGKLFSFTIDRSYVLRDADISPRASQNLMDLLSGYIFYPVYGKKTLLCFHHFFEGKPDVIDDETNYSVLIALPELAVGEYTLDMTSPVVAKLGYWHYGPIGYVIESQSYEGTISLSSVTDKVVKGSVYLSFWSTDKKRFNFHGDFELPLLTAGDMAPLMIRINEVLGSLQQNN
ncbi:MAG: hypothetical protein ACOYXB_04985 [Bacteroidota bacterium]